MGIGSFLKGIDSGSKWNNKAKNANIIDKYLNELPEGYYIFSDVKIPTTPIHIDHVVIGPNGIFSFESSDKMNNMVEYIAENNALALMKYISHKGISGNVLVKGVLAITNINYKTRKNEKIKVLDKTLLNQYITTAETKTKKEALAEIVHLLRKHCVKYSY